MSPTTTSARRGLAQRAEAAVAGFLVALAVLGVTLIPLTTSPIVSALVSAVASERPTGLGGEATLEAAEAVRVFVLRNDAPGLAAEIAGRPAFDEAAVSHLLDVRRVLIPSRWLTLILAVLVIVWLVLRTRTTPGRIVAGRSLQTAAWMLIAGAGVALLVGRLDFDAFFTWSHGLFFQPGTWTFPSDALLIQVFPLPFWTTAGALWGAMLLMSAALLIVNGRRLCFTRGTHGV